MRHVRPAFVICGLIALSLFAAPARAQSSLTRDGAAAVKAAFAADLETMKAKFIGLAQAFPQDKYTWRPMEGVRSVSEVLMLVATEGYSFIPSGVGAPAAQLGDRDAMNKLRALSDKAQVIEHLNKAFAYAKDALDKADPSALLTPRPLMGQPRTLTEITTLIGGDLHEHLGQLIAYARMNHIVPPWSK
jgi:hypothetical protein